MAWLCLNDSFLSVVSHYEDPDKLLVRARVAGHIEAVFPGYPVYQREGSDYLYRADVPRKVVAEHIALRLEHIDYSNFKNSVKNRQLHDAYAGFWTIMYRLQAILKPAKKERFVDDHYGRKAPPVPLGKPQIKDAWPFKATVKDKTHK
jgi:hypothetical protein